LLPVLALTTNTDYNTLMPNNEPYNTVSDFIDLDEPTEAEMIAELMSEGYTQAEAKRMVGDDFEEYELTDEDSE
jgi:hypothetical protein